jgi:UDP:flavonoid glycosyltransferase YjiC (YdhE family)
VPGRFDCRWLSAGGQTATPEGVSSNLVPLGSLGMRVLAACSLGGAGHLNPLLAFLAAAQRRGDETLVVGPPALREMVERAGYPFGAGGEPPETEVAPIRERLPVAPALEGSVLANRELFGRLATTAMLPGMERICGEYLPDLVLRDPAEYASAVVAYRRDLHCAQVAISLADVEAGSITVAAPVLEQHQRGLVEKLRESPYLSRFPRSLDPSPFPATIRFHEPAQAPGEPLPDWWGDFEAPLVYMTFGTVLPYMSIANDVYRMAIDAVAGLQIRALLTVSRWFDRSSLEPIPANVHLEAWVDHAQVLAAADLVVCHGGSGTVFGALAHGVPVLAVPLFADQFENGRRVVQSGAGLNIQGEHAGDMSLRGAISDHRALQIAEGIDSVLATVSYRLQARRIAAEMAATSPVDGVLDDLLTGHPEAR